VHLVVKSTGKIAASAASKSPTTTTTPNLVSGVNYVFYCPCVYPIKN